jgi:hypothetical protein
MPLALPAGCGRCGLIVQSWSVRRAAQRPLKGTSIRPSLLDIYIQDEAQQRANWLPARAGGFNMNLRPYVPDDGLQKGRLEDAPAGALLPFLPGCT